MKFFINSQNKNFVANVFSLTLIQVANFIIPIVIVPYAIRVLGVEEFGSATYAQNIVAYLTILVNFGFEYSATQNISIHKDDRRKLISIFYSVLFFKFCLLLLSFIILFVCCTSIDKFSNNISLYICAALINVGWFLFPTWFFQGVESMSQMAFFNLFSRALSAIMIFVLVADSQDSTLYVLFLSMGMILAGVCAFLYVIKKYKLYYSSKEFEFDLDTIRKGFPIFLNSVFVFLYTNAGITMMGFCVSEYDLGIYQGTHKIVMAIMMLTSMPINVALFPRISKKFDESFRVGWTFFKKSFVVVLLFSLFVSLLTFLFSDFFVDVFFKKGCEDAYTLMKMFSILPFFVTLASLLTVQGLYGMQIQYMAPFVGGLLGAFSIGLNYVMLYRMGIFGAAISWIICQFFEIVLVGMLILVKKSKKI